MTPKILGALIFCIYRLLSWTWRLKIIEPESLKTRLRNRETVLFAHWHGDELALLHLIGHYRVATMASQSRDGEMMNTAVRMVGGLTSRGSSTRGGASGLKALIRLIRDHQRNSSFAVDGPKGPRHKVKPGIFEVSRLLQSPIYPAGIACSNAWTFPKSWNKAYLPKPFARVIVNWGEALPPVSREDDPRGSKLAETLENALHNAGLRAQKELAPSKSE